MRIRISDKSTQRILAWSCLVRPLCRSPSTSKTKRSRSCEADVNFAVAKQRSAGTPQKTIGSLGVLFSDLGRRFFAKLTTNF